MNAVGFVTAGDVGSVLLAGLAFGSHQWPVVAVFKLWRVQGLEATMVLPWLFGVRFRKSTVAEAPQFSG